MPQQQQTQYRYAHSTAAAPEQQPKQLVTVEVVMPHVEKFGRDPRMRLTYITTFDVELGQTVLCPPTRLNSRWTKGRVVALDGGGYTGYLKHIAPLGSKTRRKT